MRHFSLASAMIVLMSGLSGLPAYAVGNVLVPTDDSGPSAAPGKPPASPPSTPDQTFLPPTGGSSNTQPDTLPNSVTRGYTPIPSGSTANTFAQKPPTQIVKMPAPVPVSDSSNDLPNVLNVSMQKYMWGPDDTAKIYENLSIPANQVSKYCRLSAFGTLISDSGGYAFNADATQPQTALRYGGKPSGLNVMAQAMCDTVPLPPNAGTVLQVGDKYVVFISQIQCPPPAAGAQSLVFQYAGNGKGQCVYQ
jgi:hypothetical protein